MFNLAIPIVLYSASTACLFCGSGKVLLVMHCQKRWRKGSRQASLGDTLVAPRVKRHIENARLPSAGPTQVGPLSLVVVLLATLISPGTKADYFFPHRKQEKLCPVKMLAVALLLTWGFLQPFVPVRGTSHLRASPCLARPELGVLLAAPCCRLAPCGGYTTQP